jgi:predicted RNA-binding protein associated with RNAse of E/G family
VRKVPVTPATRQEPSSRPEWFADLLSRCDWELTDSVWDVSTLWIVGEGDWHSVWVSFRDNGEHFGYYINLQRPFRRSRAGIQTMDLMLDVIADRNGSWRWKDEDDLEILLAKGLIDGATGQRVRNEAMRAIQRFQLSEAPFDGSWTSWRPPASWRAPRLARGWEDVRD